MISFEQVASDDQIQTARQLFSEYAESMDYAVCFDDFERELASLPGDYAPPDGCLLIAKYEGQPAGCVALRRLTDGVGEMKRMWVRRGFRGRKIGLAMANEVIARSRQMGYKRIMLETMPRMEQAMSLYLIMGFYITSGTPDSDNSIVRMQMDLD